MAVKTKKNYQEDLIESLKNPKEAAAYLNAVIEEGDRELFLLALRNIAKAQGGISSIAEKAHLNRENLYRMLSKRGNPEIKSLLTLLRAMGLELTVKAQKQAYA